MWGDGARDERIFLLPDATVTHVKLPFEGDVSSEVYLLVGVLETECAEVMSEVAVMLVEVADAGVLGWWSLAATPRASRSWPAWRCLCASGLVGRSARG